MTVSQVCDRKCPKCKKGQPLYPKRLRPGDVLVIAGQSMKIEAEVVVHECVRCRGVFR